MEDVIKKIIKIEEEAQSIMATTLKENNVKRKELEVSLAELKEQLVGHAHIKAKETRKKELSKNAVYAKDIKLKCELRLKEMDVKANANEEAWIDYLVKQVLGD